MAQACMPHACQGPIEDEAHTHAHESVLQLQKGKEDRSRSLASQIEPSQALYMHRHLLTWTPLPKGATHTVQMCLRIACTYGNADG